MLRVMKKTPAKTDTALYSIQFELPLVETDPNKILGRHWRMKHKRFEKIKTDIARLVAGRIPKTPLKKFRIKIVRRFNPETSRTLDWDNLIASFKPGIDGLVRAGIIQNDSWKYIRHIDSDQEKTSEGQKTALVFHVEEVR